ncbi:tandem-95 repeat protein [bacterium]|nr:MAG: tandem-95 repeat protein [bacterium]
MRSHPDSLLLSRTCSPREGNNLVVSLLLALWCYFTRFVGSRFAHLGQGVRQWAPASAAAILCVLAIALPASAANDWRSLYTLTYPDARVYPGMVYDSARNTCVLFGGYEGNNNTYFGDTWEYSGTDWVKKSPINSPLGRTGTMMAYDSARGVTVLFGGESSFGNLSDTWEYNGTNWTPRTLATNPPAFYQGTMAYDSVRHVTVLFGDNQTWEYNGTNWTRRTPTTSPSSRNGSCMAYDSARHVCVLFGGFNAGELGDTWEWNGTNWTQRTPATSPEARSGASMAYDSKRGVTVLFAGRTGILPLYDTWEWNGTNWTLIETVSLIGRRWGASMCYDDARELCVSFGGQAFIGGYFRQTCEYGVAPPLVLSGFTPAAGKIGSQVKITGSGFNSFSYVYQVLFNGKEDYFFSLDSNTQITATVPDGTTTGRISLTAANGTVTSATNFRINNDPTASNDSATVAEDSGATVISVLGNDSSTPDTGETLSVKAVTQPANGTVTLTGGVIRFTPAANFNGTTSFTYTLSDGFDGTDTATVNMTVTSVNDPPTANDDSATVAEDSGATIINVLVNDSFAPDTGETLSVTGITQPANGTVTLTSGVVRYTPPANYNGTTSFNYTLSDGNGGTDTATVTVTVTPVNDPPTANDDSATVNENSAATVINVLVNDSILPDTGETLTVTGITQPANGAATLVGGVVRYQPNRSFDGTDTFTYTISDGNGGTDTATVTTTVNNVNNDPTANDDSVTVDEDSSATVVNVLVNDSFAPDIDETLSVTAVTQPANGTVTLIGGVVRFAPAANFNGTTTFTYTLSDGNDGTDTATVTVTVTPVNDPPTATDDSATVAEDSGATIINVLVNDSFAPDSGETLSVTGVTQPANGTVTLTSGVVRFTPALNYNGTTTFTYTLSDGNGATDTATVTVTVTAVNDAPEANNNSYNTAFGTGLTVNAANGVLTNDTDVEGNALSVLDNNPATPAIDPVTAPTLGTLVLNVDGSFTYTPNANFAGTDSFTYKASDGQLANSQSNIATVTILVAANTAPIAVNDSGVTSEDNFVDIDVVKNDTDAEGSTLTVVPGSIANVKGGTAELQADGKTVRFTPNADANDGNTSGGFSFTYNVSDGTDASENSATATITVSSVNDAPVIDSVTLTPGAPNTSSTLTANVTSHDADDDTPSYTYVWKNGSTTLSEIGKTLDLSVAGNGDKGDQITVTVTANDGTVDSASVTSESVTVVNSVPAIRSVTITPTKPLTNTVLTATVVADDADGDTPTYQYVWRKNGELIAADYNYKETLDLSKPGVGDNGDIITVTVKASDGSVGSSTGVISDSVTIGNVAPHVDSVLPGNATDAVGAKRTFAVTVSDANGAGDVKEVWLLINSRLNWSEGAMFIYVPSATSPTNGLLYLRQGDVFLAPITIGEGASASQVLDNGAVRVIGNEVTVSVASDSITLNLPLTIRDGLAGQNQLFARVQDVLGVTDPAALEGDSGYVRSGTYTVTSQFGGDNVAPVLSKLTPSATFTILGSAGIAPAPQRFGFFVKDENGMGDMESVIFLAGKQRGWTSTATFFFEPRTRRLYLRSDNGQSWLGGGQIGQAGILENSQVRADLSKVKITVYPDGKSFGLTLYLQAKRGLLGQNKIWLRAQDKAGAVASNGDDQGYVQSGTWSVGAGSSPANAPSLSNGKS